MTDHEMAIEQVAGIISESPDLFASIEDAEDANEDGWSFDVRWPSHQYIADTDWTRVEGLILDPDDLRRAWAIAEEHWATYRREHAGERWIEDVHGVLHCVRP